MMSLTRLASSNDLQFLTRELPIRRRVLPDFRTNFGSSRSWSSLSVNESSLTVHALAASFPYIWLRDSCQSPTSVHPSTSQKLHRTSDIPLDIRPSPDGLNLVDNGIHIEWIDGHKSFYPTSFLRRHSSRSNLSAFHKDVTQETWDASSISKVPNLFRPYTSLRDERGLLSAITQLSRYGILFLSHVPNGHTTDETCELRKLAHLFGEIRTTFYGQVWNVKNIRNSRNIAYTNLGLGLHMDLLYFQHPPRYQILHCLRNRVVGGTSIFVDALRAALALRVNNRESFDILTSTPVAFHYINDGHHLHHEHPTIELSNCTPASATPKPIAHINYSPPFQAPLPLSTPASFYPALSHFARLLNDPKSTYTYTLKEGDAAIFDNRRVLHARTAFRDFKADEAGENAPDKEEDTNRWLKGCYFEADTPLDRGRILRSKGEQGLF